MAHFPGLTQASQSVAGLRAEVGGRIYHDATPATLTNSTTKTALASATLPANTLTTARKVRASWSGRVTAAQSTDTLTLSLDLTGGVVAYTSGAIDVATNNTFSGSVELIAQEAPSADSPVKVTGYHAAPGATSVAPYAAGPSDVATNAAVAVTLNGQWSVASASDSVTLDHFTIELI